LKPIDSHAIYRDGRHYDLQHKDFVDDIPFYIAQVRKYGDPVLELACGTGRITIPIARKGFHVTGLDVSSDMLAQAKRKSAEQDVMIEWAQADCRDFDLSERFNTVLFPFNSIAHLHDLADLEKCFACVRKHLKPDGRFILDMFNPKIEILIRDNSERYPSSEYPDPDGQGTVVVTENNLYDRAGQVNKIKWYYRIGEQAEEIVADLNMRIFYPQELDALLKYNGFEIESKFGDFDESPFVSDSPKQIPVCRMR
jgi:SAM-dependent methyltransferase